MALFPTDFYSGTVSEPTTVTYSLQDYLINMETGEIVLDELGRVTIVEGLDALNTQIWRKIHCKKGVYLIYSEDYGNTFDELFGKSKEYSDFVIGQKLKEALVDKYYVTGIKSVETSLLEDGTYKVEFQIDTVFGVSEESLTISMD